MQRNPNFLFPTNLNVGHKQPLDVSTVKQGKEMFFSILMLTWGGMQLSISISFYFNL